MNEYSIGTLVHAVGTWINAAGGGVDPAAVFAKVKDPVGNEVTYAYPADPELVRESAGVYYVDVDITLEGIWWVRFYSTGSGQAAAEQGFKIEVSRFL